MVVELSDSVLPLSVSQDSPGLDPSATILTAPIKKMCKIVTDDRPVSPVISEDDFHTPDVQGKAATARVEPRRHPNTTRNIKELSWS